MTKDPNSNLNFYHNPVWLTVFVLLGCVTCNDLDSNMVIEKMFINQSFTKIRP